MDKVIRMCIIHDLGEAFTGDIPAFEKTAEDEKKGGRIPAPLAVLGNALQIKPVIELKDKVLVMLGKARGQKGGMKYLWKEFGSYEIDKNEPVYFGYTSDKEIVEQFMEKTVAEYGLKKYEIYPVGGIIGTHVGPGCIAISFAKKENFS